MRKPRLFLHHLFPSAAYHVISRVVNRDKVFGPDEKAVLTSIMRRFERFCCLKVLTFCIMDNHFHFLVQVDPRPADADSISDDNLVQRVRLCYGDSSADKLQLTLRSLLDDGQLDLHAAARARILQRMWSLPAFVQSVKQGFSIWFNHRHSRKGTLWEERYKSVIALGPEAVASIAAYIDLNPVRAGLVEDPAHYPWSGYGEAMGTTSTSSPSAHDEASSHTAAINDEPLTPRSQHARERLREALVEREGSLLSSQEAKEHYLQWYRGWIYQRGVQRGMKLDGSPMKRGFDVHEALREVEAAGRIPAAEELQRNVRHFTDGLVLGTRDQLEQVFEQQRSYFSEKRTSGARKLRWGQWGNLRSMRDLQVQKPTSDS
jgi:putative transposase